MPQSRVTAEGSRHRGWTYLTNHTLALVCVLEDPYSRLADMASRIGITERAVQNVLRDLETEGVLEKVKEGRRNRYTVDLNHPLRLPMIEGHSVKELLSGFAVVQVPGPTNVGNGRDG